MSQIYCMSSKGTDAEKRVNGMKMLGLEIRAQITGNQPLEPAITNAIIKVIGFTEFKVYFIDSTGNPGEMRENPKKPSELQYKNDKGKWVKVKIDCPKDGDSNGTQVMHVGAGEPGDMVDPAYLAALGREAETIVKDPNWDPNNPAFQNYFLATVNLRRCR